MKSVSNCGAGDSWSWGDNLSSFYNSILSVRRKRETSTVRRLEDNQLFGRKVIKSILPKREILVDLRHDGWFIRSLVQITPQHSKTWFHSESVLINADISSFRSLFFTVLDSAIQIQGVFHYDLNMCELVFGTCGNQNLLFLEMTLPADLSSSRLG